MRILQRLNNQQPNAGGSNDNPDSGDQLQQAREQSERLLAAGDEAIRRALSGNSEMFLRSSRQNGGE